MMIHAKRCAGIALLLLSGCAANGPTRDEVAAIASDSLPKAPTNWAAVAEQVGPVRLGWIEALQDPLLQSLVAEGVANNRDLSAAEANVARSWALAKQAGAALTPSVGLSAGAGQSGSADGGSASSMSIGLQASWEVDLWGRVRSGRAAAVDSAKAAEADYRFAQHSLAASVARGYFMAIDAQRQTAVADGIVGALTRTNRLVSLQFENGMANAQDLSLAKSDLASAQDALESAKGGERDAIRALELVLGRYPGADLEVRNTLPGVPPPPAAGLPSQLLERRPDLVAAERRIASAISGVNQSQAAKLPQLSLTGSLGAASSDLSSLLNPANIAWQAASSLLVPLVSGGALDAQVEISEADQQQAVAAYASAALNAFAEVENLLDQGQVLQRRNEAVARARREAEEALRIAQLRFDAGESDLLDVLSIQQRVFTAQRSALSVERQRLDQFVNLNLALGGDWMATD